MLRRQSLMALGIAVLIGLIAVYLANSYWNARDRQADAATAGTVKVAVASIPFDYGQEVTPDKVRFVSYPAASLPPGTFKSLDELMPMGKRRIALRPIQVNQPLLAADLTGEGQNASIAALLPDGMRAASVRINAVSGVAGFVKPNDTVDVLITRDAIGADRQAQVTDVLLQNIRVIAIDQDAKGNEKKQADLGRTATLEVNPLDAQKLALGQQLGALSLVLRKPGEENNIPYVETVSMDDLRYGVYGPQRPAAGPAMAPAMANAAPAPAAPAGWTRASRPAPRRTASAPVRKAAPKKRTTTVQVMRGTEVSTYEVGGYVR